MKKYITIIAVLLTAISFANGRKPQLEEVEENLVKATYFYENGQVQQTGYFKEGKLHGEWNSFDTNGNKTAVALYENGAKVGKWYFWTKDGVKEFDYSAKKISFNINWKSKTIDVEQKICFC